MNTYATEKGEVIGLTWRGGDNAWRWQVYAPVGSKSHPKGKVLAGGTYGSLAHDEADATSKMQAAMDQSRHHGAGCA